MCITETNYSTGITVDTNFKKMNLNLIKNNFQTIKPVQQLNMLPGLVGNSYWKHSTTDEMI